MNRQATHDSVLMSQINRDDRVPKPGGATESYHLEQELRVIHEFKESVCQVMPGGWTQE